MDRLQGLSNQQLRHEVKIRGLKQQDQTTAGLLRRLRAYEEERTRRETEQSEHKSVLPQQAPESEPTSPSSPRSSSSSQRSNSPQPDEQFPPTVRTPAQSSRPPSASLGRNWKFMLCVCGIVVIIIAGFGTGIFGIGGARESSSAKVQTAGMDSIPPEREKLPWPDFHAEQMKIVPVEEEVEARPAARARGAPSGASFT
ncbi:hypothetical protein AC578_1478 [Pseudocercospora eumusae]|uniref:SAP domain-containing protein n=1 Tax=Pseudocercospora eumusae TaxID=321146 RepID=A0A139H5J9_9PEZI|nr:hypothetical protein AC578_1478 [Pseudocercospora eumusae]